MNWEAIGAIGEFVGALAVVLTLVYLALQVRQNTTGMRVAAKLEITKQFADYTDLLLLNPKLLELNLKAMQGAQLEELEQAQFNILLVRANWNFSSMFFQYRAQRLSQEEWHESQVLIDMYCTSPGYREYWEENSYRFSPDFVDYIDERMAKIGE